MGLEEGKLESSDLVMGSAEELAIFSTGMNLNSGTTGLFNIRWTHRNHQGYTLSGCCDAVTDNFF